MNTKIKNILLLSFSLIFLEVFSQLIVLIFEQKYSILLKPISNNISKLTVQNYSITWDYKNNKMKPGTYKYENISYTINSKGFRGNEFKEKKEKIRILAFGGSTTIGLESPDDKTYPFQLEKLLNKDSNKYEVINMGFSSKSLNYIKSLIFTEAFKYEPDIIIIQSVRNSIIYDGASIEPNINFLSKKNYLIKVNYFLQENIMTYRLLWKATKKFTNFTLGSEYLKSPFSNKGVSKKYLQNGYTDSIKEIIEFTNKKNIKIVLVKQAYNYEPNIVPDLNEFTSEELIQLYEKNYFEKKYKINKEDEFNQVLGTVLNKKIEEFNGFKNIIIVDPITEMSYSKDYFFDYVHLTPKGNLLLAEKIYLAIESILQKP